MNYINGNRLSDIADFIIDFDHPNIDLRILKRNAIIFCKTDFLQYLFDALKFSSNKYILITHMSDYPIDEFKFKQAPKCIVKWFAQNAIYKNDKIVSIPIGLENHIGKSKGKFTNHKWLEDNIIKLNNKDKQNKLYCNWNINTNINVRKPIIDKLKENNLPLVIEYGLSFEQYCENMSNYKWVICPPGNGADTHRLWEALYLGCYPITLKHYIYDNYNLPILQVNNWSDINTDLLNKHEENKYINDLQELDINYWSNLIKNEYNKL